MPHQDPLERIRVDYDDIAGAYDDIVRNDVSSTHLLSTAMITVFAQLVLASGPGTDVVDVGCGPGHWTELLDRLGVRARGIDLSPEMIAIARDHRPDLDFQVSSLLELTAEDGSLGGILAHFSLIHLPPELMSGALDGFARAVRLGAPLLVGVHLTDTDPDGTGWVHHDDRGTPSYRWTLDSLARLLRDSGFDEVARVRIEPIVDGRPPAGYLLTRRLPTSPH